MPVTPVPEKSVPPAGAATLRVIGAKTKQPGPNQTQTFQEIQMKALITACVIVAVLALFAGSAQAHCGGYGGHGYFGHWDYHPGYIIDHGCHFHVVPGHYHWHNTGHLHW
jgi:hypothetical protein